MSALPPHPSLEQLRKQAKDLRRARQRGEVQVLARIRAHLPRLAEATDAELRQGELSLQEAQHILAREYGFKNWAALAAVVEVDMESLVRLTDRAAQVLLREVDQKDFVGALVGTSRAVKEKFLGNMSARVRSFIEAEMDFLGELEGEESLSCRRRMLSQAAALAGKDLMDGWPGGRESPGKEAPARPPFGAETLAARALDEMRADELAQLWRALAEVARREGILALQPLEEKIHSAFVREAVRLAVDGTEPALIQELLQTRSRYGILRQLEVRGQMLIEGLVSILEGDNPDITRLKVGTLYAAAAEQSQAGALRDIAAEELQERLRQSLPGSMELPALADFLAAAGVLARQQGPTALAPLAEALDGARDMASELLRRGVELVAREERPKTDRLRGALEKQLETRLQGLERMHRGVVAGVLSAQQGMKPVEVEKAVREAAG